MEVLPIGILLFLEFLDNVLYYLVDGTIIQLYTHLQIIHTHIFIFIAQILTRQNLLGNNFIHSLFYKIVNLFRILKNV